MEVALRGICEVSDHLEDVMWAPVAVNAGCHPAFRMVTTKANEQRYQFPTPSSAGSGVRYQVE